MTMCIRLGTLAAMLLSSSVALGQAVFTNQENAGDRVLDVSQLWELTITPAREPSPALKYSLWPRYWERQYGDATPIYYRALLMHAELPSQVANQSIEKWEKWTANELTNETKNEMRTWLASHAGVLKELEAATYREHLELDLRFRDLRGMEAISFTLPDAQRMRDLARMLVIKIRLTVAEGKFDEAIETLRIGFRLTHVAAKTPTLINGLVGVAIGSMMTHELVRLVASPDAPNLYWAIASLPQPLVDFREAFEHEGGFAFQIYPFLRDAEKSKRPADEWRQLMLDAYQSLYQLTGDYKDKPGPLSEFGATALMMKLYPFAKQYLIESGMSREQLEAMPVGQVAAIYTARTYRYVFDEMFKWTLLPPAQVQNKWQTTSDRLQQERFLGAEGLNAELLPLAEILIPAIQAAWYAPLRLERQLAAVRTIEAIRMHAAEHEGQLPQSLEEIQSAVVSLDPLTGKPFDYRVEGKTGVLEMPGPDSHPRHEAIRFVIKSKGM